MLKDTDKRREKKVLAGAKLMREKKKFSTVTQTKYGNIYFK